MPTRTGLRSARRGRAASDDSSKKSDSAGGDEESELLQFWCQLKMLKKPKTNDKLQLKAIGRYKVLVSDDMDLSQLLKALCTGVEDKGVCFEHFYMQAKCSRAFGRGSMQTLYDHQWEDLIKPILVKGLKLEFFLKIKEMDSMCADCTLYNVKSSTVSKAAQKRSEDKKRLEKAKTGAYRRTVFHSKPTRTSTSPPPALRSAHRSRKRRRTQMQTSSSSSSSRSKSRKRTKRESLMQRARGASSSSSSMKTEETDIFEIFNRMVVSERINMFVQLFAVQNDLAKQKIIERCCDNMGQTESDQMYEGGSDEDQEEDDYDEDESEMDE